MIGAGPVTETISRVHPLTHEQGFVSDEINTMVLKVQETTNRTATRKRSTGICVGYAQELLKFVTSP